MNKRFIVHIDMNSYFASVEQQANPFLRGKPLGVCAYLSEYGAIIASSMEAKRYGVKTAMRVQVARELCPNLHLVENEPAKYRSTTKKIFSIFSDYSDTIEPYSIDEAFIDLTGHIHSYDQGFAVVDAIKRRIHNEVGEWLRCSAGISYTKWLAKYASDMADKNGYNVITKNTLTEKLSGGRITDAWGINTRMEARLGMLGIRTLLDLKNAAPYLLIKHLGAYGYSLWAHVNGIEIDTLRTREALTPKSIGHSYQVPAKDGFSKNFTRLLMKMCEKTGRRLRAKGLSARHISLSVGYERHERFSKSAKLTRGLYDTKSIYTEAMRLYENNHLEDTIRFIAVSVGDFQNAEWQQELFGDTLRQKRLAQAMDKINDMYGEYTMIHGTMHGMEAHGRDRVGFRKTVAATFEDTDRLTYDTEYDAS